MSLLLSSVLLFILVAPGLIFRFSYLQGTYAKVSFKVSAIDEIFWALIPALFFQLTAVLMLENIFSFSIRIDIVYQLINGDSASGMDFQQIRRGFFPFLVYTAALIGISAASGRLVRFLIRHFKLDIRYRFFRLNNEWHYLFSGEILDFPGVPGDSRNIEIIQIDLLANTSEGSIIYSGILQDYFLSKDNGLDRIYLSHVYRRSLKDDLSHSDRTGAQQLDERYYQMPGELFVIQYDQIINMNVTYHRFSLESEAAEHESEDQP
jgi:hypothetical protein